MQIEGERIYLRNLRIKDADEEYCRWLNDPKVNKYLETRNATIDDLKKYIKEKNKSDKCLFLGVFDNKTAKHIGNIKLEPIDFKGKKATFSIMIGDKNYWNKGIGTEATKLFVDYAFNGLNLKKINLGVISENKAAISVYKKAGFKVKRIEKKKLKHGSKFYDKVVMEIEKKRSELKFLVLGCGSIGRRHIKNLIGLGYKDIIACDVNNKILGTVEKEFEVKTSNNFKKSVKKANAVLICTPNNLHTKFAVISLKEGKHVFIEKPIAHNLDGLDELKRLSKKNNLKVQTGCNLIFHPLIIKAKSIINKKELGKIYSVKIEYGSYFPNWRPDINYWENYGAKKSMGGGIILDAIHEIDYAVWLFGKMTQIFSSSNKISNLKIDTEDTVEIILKTKKGFDINIHLDYLQQETTRTFKIICEKGTLEGDINASYLRVFKETKSQEYRIDFDYNQTYIDEMQDFIKCIIQDIEPKIDIQKAVYDLKLAVAAKKSSEENRVVLL